MLTDKEKRFADKLKRYFQNEDEYNYKNVMSNAIKDKNFEKVIISYSLGQWQLSSTFDNDTRKYEKFYRYKPKGDDE